jgi:hypothetical protein
MNPDAPPPSTPARIATALGRSREVVIFAAGVIFGVLAVIAGRLT